MTDIQRWIDQDTRDHFGQVEGAERAALVDNIARRNVVATVLNIRQESETLSRLASEGRVAIVGAMYDVGSGKLDFLGDTLIDPTASLVKAIGRGALVG